MTAILAPLFESVNSAPCCASNSNAHNSRMEKSKKSKIEPFHLEEAARLKSLYKERVKDISQADFGAKYEIGSQGMVWQYLNGKSPLNLLAAIKFSQGIGCQIAEFSERLAAEYMRPGQSSEIVALRNGAGLSPSPYTKASSNVESLEPINVEQAPGLRGKVPLISFVQAGAFAETIDNFQPGDAEEWVDATCPVNRHTFALRVVGDSMEPDFPAGTILIVEPELSPEQNDFVIAKNGDNEATFKQLTRDGADWYLKPLNSRYPIKPLGSSRIIGVVRDAVRKFR